MTRKRTTELPTTSRSIAKKKSKIVQTESDDDIPITELLNKIKTTQISIKSQTTQNIKYHFKI